MHDKECATLRAAAADVPQPMVTIQPRHAANASTHRAKLSLSTEAARREISFAATSQTKSALAQMSSCVILRSDMISDLPWLGPGIEGFGSISSLTATTSQRFLDFLLVPSERSQRAVTEPQHRRIIDGPITASRTEDYYIICNSQDLLFYTRYRDDQDFAGIDGSALSQSC
jgi:hypothetical protein